MKVLETEYKGFKVDDNGNVYGKRGKILKGCIDRCGYKEVCLSLKGKQKNLEKKKKDLTKENKELKKELKNEKRIYEELSNSKSRKLSKFINKFR